MNAGDVLAGRLQRGEAAALARAITRVESGAPEGLQLLRAIRPALGRSATIGVTGPPGAGKSTLVNALVHGLRGGGHRVGVIAVDPSSPLSGGAILGDRVRMGDHDLDDDVFVRSLSSGGERGGLSVAAVRVAELMDAAGFDRVILETVGAGQAEVDIADLADARVVVCAPGLGDDIQAMKAGILEIADVLVVNKADLPQAARLAGELRAAFALRASPARETAIVECIASRGDGIDALLALIDARLAALPDDPVDRARRRMRRLLAKAAALEAERLIADGGEALDSLCDALQRAEIDLPEAVRRLFGQQR